MKAFISYSHHDADLLSRLHQHLAALRRDGLIETWTDREIPAGGIIDEHVNSGLKAADVYLLLVSSAFLDSHYCFEREFEFALERQQRGETIIVPIIVRDCDWKIDALRKFKALPEDGKAMTGRHWHTLDEACANVASGLRALVESGRAPAKRAKKAKAKFVPDERHITEDERTVLGALCDKVVERLAVKAPLLPEAEAKKLIGRSYGIVWGHFNEDFELPELAALPREKFDDAKAWFRQYKARNNKKLKRIDPYKYRNALIGGIHGIKSGLGWTDEKLYAFATEKLESEVPLNSLGDLKPKQLELLKSRLKYEEIKKRRKTG